MKPTEFLLNEGNQHCPKCDCNTVTTDNGKCKLCGTKKLEEEQVVEQQMLDVATIYLEAKKQGDKQTMLAAQQKLAELNEVKHFRTTYGWAGGRNEKTGGVHKHPGNKEYTVYCSQCGGEFKRSNKNGFSHCKDHDGMHNYDLDEEGKLAGNPKKIKTDSGSAVVFDKGIKFNNSGYTQSFNWEQIRKLESGKKVRGFYRDTSHPYDDADTHVYTNGDEEHHIPVAELKSRLSEEGGRWEYDNAGNKREVTPQQAAAHAKANLARMNKDSNPFDDDEYGNHQKHAKDDYGNVFHEDENLVEVKSGEIANHPWVCRRAKIRGTNEVGEVIRVCREHTFSRMVPFVTMVWIKLDSGETKEVRQNMVQIAKKTAGLDEDTSSSCIATAPSGKTGPSGPAGSLFGGPQKRVQEEGTPSNTYGVKDKKGYNVYTGTKEGAQNYVKKNPGKGLSVTNIKKAGSKKVTEAAGAWRDDSPSGFAQEILEFVRDEFGGQAWFKGGSYAYKVDASKPNQLVASDGSVIECKNIAQALAEYCDSGVFNDFADCDQSYWSEFFRPVKNKIPMARDGAPMYGGEQERNELANMRGESKSNVLKGIVLAEYSTAAQRAEADKSYQEFIAKGGQPKPAPNKKYKEPSPGTGCGGTRVAGRGEAARGGGSGKPGLKSRTGKAAHNPIARPKIVGEDGQLNEYKPKIIPKTLAGGKLNPNHPGNADAIAKEKEAIYQRKEQQKAARAPGPTGSRPPTPAAKAKAKERKRDQLRAKYNKIRAKLGRDTPQNPLEKKAQDAMWRVWNAIAPDAIAAMKYPGYTVEDEMQLEDPFYIAEVCTDANVMQTFAELTRDEEDEILDTLDRNTLARLVSDFGI